MAKNKYDTSGISVSKPEPSNNQKYFQLLSNMREQVKTMGLNQLSREYVSLFAQYVLLQRRLDDMLEKQNQSNEQSPTNTEEKNV